MSDIKIAVGTLEGFTSSLNLVFPNGLVLGTKDMVWLSRDEKLKTRDQFIEVARQLGLSEEEILKVKL